MYWKSNELRQEDKLRTQIAQADRKRAIAQDKLSVLYNKVHKRNQKEGLIK